MVQGRFKTEINAPTNTKMPKRKAEDVNPADVSGETAIKKVRMAKDSLGHDSINPESAGSADSAISGLSDATRRSKTKVRPASVKKTKLKPKGSNNTNVEPFKHSARDRLSKAVKAKLRKVLTFVESEQGKADTLSRSTDRPEMYEVTEASLQAALAIMQQEYEIAGPVEINDVSDAVIERREYPIGTGGYQVAHYVLDLTKPTVIEARIQEKMQGWSAIGLCLLQIELQMYHHQLERNTREGLLRFFEKMEVAGGDVNANKGWGQKGVCPAPPKQL